MLLDSRSLLRGIDRGEVFGMRAVSAPMTKLTRVLGRVVGGKRVIEITPVVIIKNNAQSLTVGPQLASSLAFTRNCCRACRTMLLIFDG